MADTQTGLVTEAEIEQLVMAVARCGGTFTEADVAAVIDAYDRHKVRTALLSVAFKGVAGLYLDADGDFALKINRGKSCPPTP